jgi:hypothetical protein
MLKKLPRVIYFLGFQLAHTFESLKYSTPLHTTIMKTKKLFVRKSTITKFENKETNFYIGVTRTSSFVCTNLY